MDTKGNRNLLSLFTRTVLGILLVIFFLFVILHIPAVQSFITSKVINRVTKDLDGDVKIGSASINVYKGITLKDISIVSNQSDTLSMIQKISLSPKSTLFTLISDKMALNDLNLSGVNVKLIREKGEEKFNWEKFIGEKSSDSRDDAQPNFDLSSLRINELAIKYSDFENEEFIDGSVSLFEVDLNALDLNESGVVDISRILLLNPVFIYHNDQSKEIGETPEGQIEKKELRIPQMSLKELTVIDGTFQTSRELAEDLVVKEIDLTITELELATIDEWELKLEKISAITQRDRISYGSIDRVSYSEGQLNVSDATLNVNKSKLRFSANALSQENDISNPSSISLTIDPSIFYLNDAFTIFPSLSREFGNEPFSSKKIQIGGKVVIEGENYTGKDLLVWLNDRHSFFGDVYFEKREEFDQSILNAAVYNLRSDLPDLSRLSERFVIPKDLERLENVEFQGTFDGFLNDFVASGLLTSHLGNADLDIKFDLSGNDQELILYDGFLSLDSFNLRGLTLNDDFGYVDADVQISNGRGPSLTLSTADIDANINRFDFKDFIYKNAVYNGQLSSRVIDGQFRIVDEELNFEFDGLVDFSDTIPIYDFSINAQKINFCQLNITDFPCEISFASDINLKGTNLSSLSGNAILEKVKLFHDSTELVIEDISILSSVGKNENEFSLRSDFVDLNVKGRFNLLQALNQSVDQVISNIEGHNDVWNYSFKAQGESNENYKYNVQLKNASALFDFFGIDMVQNGIAHLNGGHNASENSLHFSASIPSLEYGAFKGDSILFKIVAKENDVEVFSSLKNFQNGGTNIESINLTTEFDNNGAGWSFEYLFDRFNRARLNGVSTIEQNGYSTIFKDHDILIDSTRWRILSQKGIGIFSKSLDIDNFTISDGERYVSLRDVNQSGIEISLNDFELALINPIINYDKTLFSGTTDGKIRIDNVFEDRSIYGFVEVPDFKINGDDFGHLIAKAQRNLENTQVINLDLSIEKDTQSLTANGYVDLESSYLFTDINISDYPMNFFEYIIDDGISETTGTTDISARIFGSLDDLKMSGEGFVKNGGVRVDYIGAYYRMMNERVTLDEKFIDFSEVVLLDELDNRAIMSGGLRHNLLADIRADLVIQSPRFIGLNTTYQDNPIYYGQGIGQLEASFKGPFDAIDIIVNGTLGELSRLSIPLLSSEYVFDESFIVFENKIDTVEQEKEESLADILKERGVDFELNLTFTPDAVVTVIYDEATSNVLEGTGEGNIKLEVKRDGAFNAYGNYDITSGRYLYTAYGFIAKPFIIRNGGTVTWTGDPLNATLDIVADHSGLRAPLTNFLGEYIGTSGITAADLSFTRDLELKLLLTGTLFDPVVNFDIDFPNLTGQLRTLAQNKVRTLRATENGINNQVVGLLLFRNFLPDNNGLAAVPGVTVGASGNNTITQFLTSQLSLMASDYLSSRLGEDNFITAIDFEIAVAQNTSLYGEEDGLIEGLFDVVPDEVQLNLRNQFKNDNFVLNLGGNYVRESQLRQADNYITGDFSLDWYLTDDRRLKLRFYGNYDYDDAFSARRQRYGFGINYRKEFGTMTDVEFQRALDNLVDEIESQNLSTGSN